MRRNFTTTFDEDLLLEIKVYTFKRKISINEVLEDLIRQLLEGKITLTQKKEAAE